jgi:DNA-binding MarR family transcriptional regulator
MRTNKLATPRHAVLRIRSGAKQVARGTEPCALSILHRASQCADELFHMEAGDLDITPRQFAVLERIAEQEGLSQTDLVERTGIDRSTMGGLIQRLVKKRFVLRRRTEGDARTYELTITIEGCLAVEQAKIIAHRVTRKLLSALPSNKARDVLPSLELIVAAASRPARRTRSKPTLTD